MDKLKTCGMITTGYTLRRVPSYKRVITVTGTAESLPKFQIPIRFNSDSQLAAHATSSGNDVRFFTTDGTPLTFDKASYSAGCGVWWVLIPSLTSSGTQIVMTYRDRSLTENASSRNTWPGHHAVLHFQGSGADSGPESRNGIETGTATYSNGILGKCYDRNPGHWLDVGTEPATSHKSISYWMKLTSYSGWSHIWINPYHYNSYADSALRYAGNYNGSSFADTNWHYVHFLYESGVAVPYIDGVSQGISGGRPGWGANTGLHIGEIVNENGVSMTVNDCGVKLCEFRLYDRDTIPTTNARIAYDYNIVANHANYVTYGTETLA